MILKEMFSKEIDRDIKGVIKVGQGDDENIRQETRKEYVVTRELQKHFANSCNYRKGIHGHTDRWEFGSQVSLVVVNLTF